MRRFRILGICLAVWASGWVAVSATQAAGPTDGIPESASVVIRIKAPQTSLDKLGDYVDAVQPGVGGAVKAALMYASEPLKIQDMKNVDATQDWWAVVFATSGESPSVVLMIPAKNADTLKDSLSDDVEAFTSGKYVVYSEDEETLGTVQEQFKGKATGLWSKLDAASKKLFDSSDLAVFVNMKQLTEEYDEELEMAGPQLDALLEQFGSAIPENQREGVITIYHDLGHGLLDCVSDSTSMTLGLTFSKSAIQYESRLQVEKDSDTAKTLAKQTTGTLDLINRLPAKQTAYFAAKFDLAEMIDWSMKMTKAMMADLSDEDEKKLDAGMKDLKTLKYDEFAGYATFASDSPALRAGSVSMVTPTKKMREISHLMLKTMKTVEQAGIKQTIKLEPGVDKIGAAELDRITIKQEVDADKDPLGIQAKVQKALFGENGMQQLALYQPNRVLQVVGGSKGDVQSLITTLDATPAPTSAIATARKRFADKANLIALVDLAQIIANGAMLAANNSELSINKDAIKSVKLDPSFIGAAVICEPTGLRSQVDIPLLQAQNIAKIVAPLVASFQR